MSILNRTRASLFAPRPRWTGCTPPTAAERMAAYSQRYAAEIQARENAGAAQPKVRLVDGRAVLVALNGRPNTLPKDAKASD
ncbi:MULTISPECIES: hypothetical protein [unclassified Rhodanobacter]|uniref:hypothetical protein n=1 Tax=unclassified Rhodanobacter TaxID=2621553 RepID=UPI001BDF651F|nr:MULTISPECIES: hypothetical protein [unclassified Rhodanobacter]MBT2142727.1 hypothetical protein [Rhodanobacter sp. LX-99]MBT2148200.1 hypothetical protein [Rhodanobacter sp. LX-100]